MPAMGQPNPRWTLAEFLAWEETQPERHEFIAGEVFAMVGARRVHGTVSGNVFAMLREQLRGSPCRASVGGMKLEVADDTICYPDVFVTCDPADLRTEQVFRAPTVIVEVLSPSTESFDRGLKFGHYRRLASLQEYLLVDPDRRSVELFRRGAEGLFTLHEPHGAGGITLTSVGCTLALDEVFEGLGDA
jgi:Uma2 family endonuclease